MQKESSPSAALLPVNVLFAHAEVILETNDAAQQPPFNRLIPFEFPYLTPGFNGPKDYLLHLADERPVRARQGEPFFLLTRNKM